MTPDPIRINPTSRSDRKRHKREYVIALVFLLVMSSA